MVRFPILKKKKILFRKLKRLLKLKKYFKRKTKYLLRAKHFHCSLMHWYNFNMYFFFKVDVNNLRVPQVFAHKSILKKIVFVFTNFFKKKMSNKLFRTNFIMFFVSRSFRFFLIRKMCVTKNRRFKFTEIKKLRKQFILKSNDKDNTAAFFFKKNFSKSLERWQFYHLVDRRMRRLFRW